MGWHCEVHFSFFCAESKETPCHGQLGPVEWDGLTKTDALRHNRCLNGVHFGIGVPATVPKDHFNEDLTKSWGTGTVYGPSPPSINMNLPL